MAETKTQTVKEMQKLEREYIIPLRKAWLKVPMYERTGKAIKAIKIFIAKHMKVPDRDTNKVKLDVYFNNEIWFKGRANPPSKIKVKATKEGDIVKVNFVETPKYVRLLKAKHEKMHKEEQKKVEEKPKEEKKEPQEKTEEQKKDEKEKETAVAEQHMKEAKQENKAQKHIGKIDKKKTQPQRMALQK